MNSVFMLEAIKEAEKSASMGEVPVGAVVVLNNEIISRAHNLCEKNSDATAHAELLAIQNACKKLNNFRLTGAELYVTLEPCPMCAGAAANARISEIIFGAADTVKGALGGTMNMFHYNLPNKPQVFGGIFEKECSKLLTDFFESKR